MSITFQVYPRNNEIPSVKEVSDIASMELAKYFQKLGINQKFSILFGINRHGICQLVEDNSILMNILEGYFYVYVKEYIENNDYNFQCFVNYKGYHWYIEGREPFMGMIAGAIGKITDGLIESGDGAWDIEAMPIEGSQFFDSYGNVDAIKDSRFRRSWEFHEMYLI